MDLPISDCRRINVIIEHLVQYDPLSTGPTELEPARKAAHALAHAVRGRHGRAGALAVELDAELETWLDWLLERGERAVPAERARDITIKLAAIAREANGYGPTAKQVKAQWNRTAPAPLTRGKGTPHDPA
jgi:hypothetical protein